MTTKKRLIRLFSILCFAAYLFHGTPASATGSPGPDIERTETGLYYEYINNGILDQLFQFLYLDRTFRGLAGLKIRAGDVNAFDEVPDSGWFVNRQGKAPMSEAALIKGPGHTSGPRKPFHITQAKVQGRSFGFHMRDAGGNRYLIKLDPPGNPEMMSGAEVVSSRFFHAIGYHVPEYTITRFSPGDLRVTEDAWYYDTKGGLRPLTKAALLDLLEQKAEPVEEGVYRASASRFLEGDILGPWKFRGTRQGDPEDLIAHEDRRVVRALRVFSSWLGHHDVGERNSLAVAVKDEGGYRVKHYLIDFGSTLGSGGYHVKPPEAGHVYWVDLGQISRNMVELGFGRRPWLEPATETYPSVGNFGYELFEPGGWKPLLPQFAFDDMTHSDAFWAARVIMKFSDEDIRRIVHTGEYSDPEAEEYLVRALVNRRDRIGKYWLSRINPLDDLKLELKPDG
ncbi:MAG: hypothetical protein GF392_01140, partial [Candidatus Omnitrophica bacterium]|nr:hypothetical protein [Candidatus Omnitrophota bacterium]